MAIRQIVKYNYFWIFVFLSTYLIVLWLGNKQNLFISDGDAYFHMATGQWILAHHAIPRINPFPSQTIAGHPWIVYHWLSDIFLAVAKKIAGWPGILILQGLALSTTMAILADYLYRRLGFWFALVLVIFSFNMLLLRIAPRPQILILPFAILWFLGFIRARAENTAPSYWNLIPLWFLVNLHAVEAAVAIVVATAFLFEAGIDLRRTENGASQLTQWKLFFLAACVVSMMTPFTYKTWLICSFLVNSPTHSFVLEWSPTYFQLPTLNYWFIFIIAMGFCVRLRIPWFRLLLFLGLSALVFWRFYVISLFSIFAPLLLADSFHQAIPWRDKLQQDRAKKKSKHIITLLFLIIVSFVTIYATKHITYRKNNPFAPADAVDFAEKNGLFQKRFVSTFEVGGYLMYKGLPTFMDPRVELYDPEFFADYYVYVFRVHGGAAGLENYLDKNKIEWVLYPPESAVVKVLSNSTKWKYVYGDRYAAIVVRKN